MGLARFFVFPSGTRWVVALDGRIVGVHADRDGALLSAIGHADRTGSVHHDADVLLESEGKLDLAWTYGVDAPPATPAVAA